MQSRQTKIFSPRKHTPITLTAITDTLQLFIHLRTFRNVEAWRKMIASLAILPNRKSCRKTVPNTTKNHLLRYAFTKEAIEGTGKTSELLFPQHSLPNMQTSLIAVAHTFVSRVAIYHQQQKMISPLLLFPTNV